MMSSQLIATGSGVLICSWAFWRLNLAPSRGDWTFKLSVAAVFAACSAWTFDSLRGDLWLWDISALLAAIAAYLVAGMVRHLKEHVLEHGLPIKGPIGVWLPRRTVPWVRKLNPVWALFGNEDDGPCATLRGGGADEWRPDLTGHRRCLAWWLRNPFHNLTFYVLGAADRRNVAYGRDPTTVFYGAAGWNWAITLGGQWFPLPFLSWHGVVRGKSWQMYAGWRPPQGSFGFKFRRVAP